MHNGAWGSSCAQGQTHPVDLDTNSPDCKMPTQTDEAPMPHAPPIPTPDDDGNYTCDMCHQKVHVGSGGTKNFLQHQGSPGCLKAVVTSRQGRSLDMMLISDLSALSGSKWT